MGVAELIAAFNEVAEPRYSCIKATLGYKREHDVEWQVLTFSGIGSDGTGFEHVEKLRPQADVIAGAKMAAQKLLDQGKPLS